MRVYTFLLLFTLYANAWNKLYPLKSCESFYFEYEPTQTQSGLRYRVRFPVGNYERQFDVMPFTLNSLDNLTQLTEEINQRAPQSCKEINNLTLDIVSCLNSAENNNPLNPEFIQFSKSVLAFVSPDIKSCEDFYELEVIGQDIERMSIKDIKSKDRSKRADIVIGRLFTFLLARDNIKEYNLFAKCGAKKFSSDFLRNVILLMARQECMFPPPEGYLHFDQVLNIANEVGSKYENQSILAINFKHYDKILKESYKKFAKTTVQQTIADTLGKKFDDPKVVEIANKSKNLQYLEKKLDLTKKDIKIRNKKKRFNGKRKTTKEDHLSQYLSEVFTTDVTFELAPQILETMLNESIKDALPEDMNNDGKNNEKDILLRKKFLKEIMLPKAMEKYNKCIEPTIKYLAINENPPNPQRLTSKNIKQQNIDDQIKVNKRLKLKCKNHPKYPLCLDKREARKKRKADRKNPKPLACGVSQGSFFQDKDKDETHKIQACAYDSIFDVMPDIFDLLITNTLDGIEKDQELNFPSGFSEKLKEMGMSNIKSCFNKKIKDKYQKETFQNNKINLQILENINSTDFIESVFSCAEDIEDDLALEVYTGAINEMDIVKTSYKKIFPELSSDQINNKARELVERGLDDCNKKMYDIIDGKRTELKIDDKDSLMCLPIIETLVAAQIVENYSIEQMVELGTIKDSSDKHPAIEEFRACKEKAYNNSINALGNSNSTSPITNAETAENYLNNNGEFYECVSQAIQGMVDDATGIKFEELVMNKDSVKDKKYALSLMPQVREVSKACFKRKLDQIGSWGDLKDIFTKEEAPKDKTTATGIRVQHELAPITPDLKYTTQKEKESKGGFDILIEECEQEIEVYATSRVMQNEVLNELEPLVKDSLIYQGTNGKYNKGDILALAIAEMRREYDIKIDPTWKRREILDKSLEKILTKEIQLKGKSDGALERFEFLITKHTLNKVRDNFFSELDTATSISSDNFKILKQSIPPTCVKNLYENLAKNLDSNSTEKIDITSLKKTIIDEVSSGIEFLEKLGNSNFISKMDEIKNLCHRSKDITSLDMLMDTTAFDFIIKNKVHALLGEKLHSGVDDLFINNLKDIGLLDKTKTYSAKELYNRMKNIKLAGQSNEKLIKARYIIEQYKMSKDALGKWVDDPKMLDQILFNDDKITTFAMKNISELLPSDGITESPKMKELTSIVLEKLFEDKDLDSFANDFTKAIVIGGVGAQGLDQAMKKAGKEAANEAIKGLKTEAKNYAQKYVKELWTQPSSNANSVASYLKWDKVAQFRRTELIESVYNNALNPVANGNEQNIDAITEEISDFTSGWHIKSKTFEDRVTDYVTPKTTDATIKDGVGQAAKFLFLSPITWPFI